MTLAHELKCHLHEVMGWSGPMTERQWEVWQHWLREQWNKPSRTDHYLMQLVSGINALITVNTGKEQPEVKPLEFKWEEKRVPIIPKSKQKIEEVKLIDTATGKEIVHKVPQRLTKEGVQKAEQAWRLFQLSQASSKRDKK